MTDPLLDRTPVIVGAGLISQRVEDPREAREPLALMVDAALDAAADAGAPRLLREVDRVLVPVGRWDYGDAGRLIARAVGAAGVDTVAAMPGVSQQTIMSDAATAIAEGDIETALVVGGEAGHRLLRARIEGVELADTPPEGEADVVLTPDDKMLPPHERERGLGVMPVGYYALMETAWRHARGLSVGAHQARMAARYARFSEVAAANPYGWDREATDVETIRSARRIAAPYGKHHVSNWSVDQASALLLTSVSAAARVGVPRERWVFPQAFTEANHMVDVAARRHLHRCIGAEVAGPAALDAAGCTTDDLDLVELYTCFPNAIETYADALGLGDDREWSFTGAMPFAGGPFNNFVLHAVGQAVRHLRGGRHARALVTTVSGVLTKQGFAVLGTEENPHGYRFVDCTGETARRAEVCEIDASHRGRASVAGLTVMHDRGGPRTGVIVADLPDGRRSVAMTSDPALMDDLEREDFVGRPVMLDGAAFTVRT
ncbi:MAG: hypothetical protein AAF480_15395 [Actinomycetota bacterium]